MKREIKFRVWDNVNYMSSTFTLQDLQNRKIQLTPECIIMQYTGIEDKNGKEIYEGDIVIAYLSGLIEYEMKSTVEFVNGCFGIRALEDEVLVDSKGQFKSFDGCNSSERIEVIGSIHENPELLEVAS